MDRTEVGRWRIDCVLTCDQPQRQGCRMHRVAPLFQLNSHLTKCFSAFCSAPPGKISPLFLSHSTPLTIAFLTKREQLCGSLLVPRLCVVQDPFSTTRKRGRYRAMAHVLVYNWLRGRHRFRRMAHQLVSLPSKRISRTIRH